MLLQLKRIQLVFQPTTCRNGLNLCIIFVKLVLKIRNLVPNMCVTKNIYNFFDIYVQLVIDWKFGLSISLTTHHSLRALWQNGGWKCFWSREFYFYSAIVTVRNGTPLDTFQIVLWHESEKLSMIRAICSFSPSHRFYLWQWRTFINFLCLLPHSFCVVCSYTLCDN